MKVLVLVLLCAVAAVQGRSAKSTEVVRSSPAILGEAPWFAHLRIAISTSGLLETCGGSLVSSRYVLTIGDCLARARFVWVRLGGVSTFEPQMVIESSSVQLHPSYDSFLNSVNLGMVPLNRDVVTTTYIRPITIGSGRPSTGKFCHFGQLNSNTPGTSMGCFEGSLGRTSIFNDDIVINSNDGEATRFDLGAPLTNSDNEMIGVLFDYPGLLTINEGTFLRPENHLDWISQLINSA